jgi:hypothetical protein
MKLKRNLKRSLNHYMNILTLVFVLFGKTCFALAVVAPIIPSGDYVFAGEITTAVLFRQEHVVGSIDAIEARTNQLISDGYECRRASDSSQTCRKALTNQPLPAAELARQQKIEDAKGAVQIGSLRADAELINDGVLSRQWSVPQSIRVQGKTYDHFLMTLIVATPSHAEILKIRTPNGAQEFIVDRTAGNLGYPIESRLPVEGISTPGGDSVLDDYLCFAQRRLNSLEVDSL